MVEHTPGNTSNQIDDLVSAPEIESMLQITMWVFA
jgi:hypothetical protein